MFRFFSLDFHFILLTFKFNFLLLRNQRSVASPYNAMSVSVSNESIDYFLLSTGQ